MKWDCRGVNVYRSHLDPYTYLKLWLRKPCRHHPLVYHLTLSRLKTGCPRKIAMAMWTSPRYTLWHIVWNWNWNFSHKQNNKISLLVCCNISLPISGNSIYFLTGHVERGQGGCGFYWLKFQFVRWIGWLWSAWNIFQRLINEEQFLWHVCDVSILEIRPDGSADRHSYRQVLITPIPCI